MADISFDEQGTPTAPFGVQNILYPDSSTKRWTQRDSTGRCITLGGVRSWNVADVVANAAETYLAGSAIEVPQHQLQAGTTFRWRMYMTKTAAGVAAPIWRVRVGFSGTVADAQVLIFTGPAQTAVVDAGYVEIHAVLRNAGAAAVLAGGLSLTHNLATTGLATVGSPTLVNVSAGFNTVAVGLFVGVTVNPGTAGVWTHQVVTAEALNI